MSPSQSPTTVTAPAPASISAALACVAARQRRLSFSANGRLLQCTLAALPSRANSSACTRPSKAPVSPSTAIVGCRPWFVPDDDLHILVKRSKERHQPLHREPAQLIVRRRRYL